MQIFQMYFVNSKELELINFEQKNRQKSSENNLAKHQKVERKKDPDQNFFMQCQFLAINYNHLNR